MIASADIRGLQCAGIVRCHFPFLPSGYIVLTALSADLVIVPVLAQRLLINIRMADYVGRRPIASKLLFAPPASDTLNDSSENSSEYVPMGSTESSGLRQKEKISSRGMAGESTSV